MASHLHLFSGLFWPGSFFSSFRLWISKRRKNQVCTFLQKFPSFCRFLQNFNTVFAYLRTIYIRPLANFSRFTQLALRQPALQVGRDSPSLVMGRDVAYVAHRQLSMDAPGLGLRMGTRCFLPPQCTCTLRCARASLGGAQGLFYKEAVVRDRKEQKKTEPNEAVVRHDTEQKKTEPN